MASSSRSVAEAALPGSGRPSRCATRPASSSTCTCFFMPVRLIPVRLGELTDGWRALAEADEDVAPGRVGQGGEYDPVENVLLNHVVHHTTLNH